MGGKKKNTNYSYISWVVPLPRMPVTTRDPYKPSFATGILGGGPHPIYIYNYILYIYNIYILMSYLLFFRVWAKLYSLTRNYPIYLRYVPANSFAIHGDSSPFGRGKPRGKLSDGNLAGFFCPPCWSHLKGGMPRKYPQYKVYMRLIIKGPPSL